MNKPTPAQILQRLREFFSDESRWTQFAYAKHANGNSIGASSPNAACFCLSGAIIRLHPEWEELSGPKERARLTNSPEYDVLEFNILELFPRRINFDRPKGIVEQFNDHPDTAFDDILKVLTHECSHNPSPRSSP